MDPGGRQLTLADTFARNGPAAASRIIGGNGATQHVWKEGHEGVSLSDREKMRVALRRLLSEHTCSSHRGLYIHSITDRRPAGFNVEIRHGHTLSTIVVCGVNKIISKVFATEEGNRVVNSMYAYSSSSATAGSGSNGDGNGKLQMASLPPSGTVSAFASVLANYRCGNASERGKRIHQLIYHRSECLPADMTLSASTENSIGTGCGCLQKLHAREWNASEQRIGDRIINYITNALDLTPLMSEFFLWDPELKFGTRADLLCLTSHMTYVLVSLKTGRYGRDGHPGNTGKYFKPPMDKVQDSIQTRHMIQLLMEALLLTKQYSIFLSDAFILYVHMDEWTGGGGEGAGSSVGLSVKRCHTLTSKMEITTPMLMTILEDMIRNGHTDNITAMETTK